MTITQNADLHQVQANDVVLSMGFHTVRNPTSRDISVLASRVLGCQLDKVHVLREEPCGFITLPHGCGRLRWVTIKDTMYVTAEAV